ncbi:hypothetical protein V8C34DRAFT_276118 [Trichoderma compactum]
MCRCMHVVLRVHVPVRACKTLTHAPGLIVVTRLASYPIHMYILQAKGARQYIALGIALFLPSLQCLLLIAHCRFNRPCLNSCAGPHQVNTRACDVYARHWLATCMLAYTVR